MTGPAHSHTEAVAALGRSLRAYGSQATTSADQAAAATRRSLDFAEGHVRDRRARLSAAENALQACLADPDADCGAEQRRVVEAERLLAVAREARGIAERTVHRVAAVQRRFVTETASRVSDGSQLTSRKGADLESYLRSGGGGMPGGSGGAASGAGPAPDALPAGVRDAPGLPPGYGLVPLSLIDDGSDAVTGPAEFGKGYRPEDLAWAFGAFDDVVLAAVGGSPDVRGYLRSRDANEGRLGTRSYDDTYAGFLGGDAIKLDLGADGRFTVANGRHRIWVARQMGRDWVPARVRG